jgi:hypothetical protein
MVLGGATQAAEFCTFLPEMQRVKTNLGLATGEGAGDYVDGGGQKWSKVDDLDQNQAGKYEDSSKVYSRVGWSQLVKLVRRGSTVLW